MQKKHILIASSMVVGMTLISVVWAAGDGRDPIVTPAAATSVSEESAKVFGQQTERSQQATSSQDTETNEQLTSFNNESQPQEINQRTIPQTSQEINDALSNLDLGGWDDDELSDDELGLP